MIGAACGAPLALLVKHFGWRATLFGIGVAQLVLAILVFLIVRDRKAAREKPSLGLASLLPSGGSQTDQESTGLAERDLRHLSDQPRLCRLRRPLGRGLHPEVNSRFNDRGRRYRLDFVRRRDRRQHFFGWWSDLSPSAQAPHDLRGAGTLVTMASRALYPGIPRRDFGPALRGRIFQQVP